MKLNQKGFGVVEGLLIFVIVGIVGGTGYYVYKNNQNDKPVDNYQPAQQVKKENNKEKTETKPKEDPNVFKVPEANFMMVLPAGLEDLSYTVDSQYEGMTSKDFNGKTYKQYKSVLFTSKSVAACGPNAVANVSFYDVDPSTLSLAYTGKNTVKIGSLYANQTNLDGGVCSQAPSLADTARKKIKLFEEAFKTAKPIQ